MLQSDNRFAFKRFREINAQDTTGGNIIISPLSVAMALSMAYNGAAGETQAAMQRTLELEGVSLSDVNPSYRSLIDLLQDLDSPVESAIANSIWCRQGKLMVPAFLDATRTYFDAAVDSADFQDPHTMQRINDRVSRQTRGKITEIVTAPLPPNTVQRLINAIYFKGDWTQRFEKSRTKPQSFTLEDGSTTSVQMTSRADEAPEECDLAMKDVLTAPGMGIAFRAGEADFSNTFDGGGPWIDDGKRKAFLHVNQEGTTAAAVTDVIMVDSAPPSLVVDRPFRFAIRERYSGSILFMGKIVNPAT